MGVIKDTVITESFQMDYCCFGKGKKIFVIIPGLSLISVMLSADLIANDYSLLADDYTVYVFDRRKDLPSVYSVYDMAEDTAGAIRALGLTDVNLFGASQGGMISMVIAARYPELLHTLLLGSTCADMRGDRACRLNEWVDLARKNEIEKLCFKFADMVYPEEFVKKNKAAFSGVAALCTDEDTARFITVAEGTRDFCITDELSSIECPVLILGAEDDKVLPPSGSEQIFDSLPDGIRKQIHMYTGYGHAAFDLAPDYKQRLLDFMTELENQ